MHVTSFFTTALLAVAASAQPLEKRQNAMCGQWDNVVTGAYTLYNNLWGRDQGSGSQCTTLDGTSGSTIRWSTRWSWSGGPYNVKSYANVVTRVNQVALSRIANLRSVWNWSYSGSGLVANVAWDIFTGASASSGPQYEIMIWTGTLGGAGPISSTGQPIATVNLAGRSWRLWKGAHSQMTVFSFVADGNVQSFNADLMAFVNYLISSQGLPASQIFQTVGAGTEPFVGQNGVFTTSAYSLVPTYR